MTANSDTPANALVFDIETIAGLTAENREAVAALAQQREQSPEHYAALCPPLARVVCIAWYTPLTRQLGAVCDASLSAATLPGSLRVSDGTTAAAPRDCPLSAAPDEAELLRQFGRLIEAHQRQPNAVLVTYNGRGFDLPVLFHRSITHGVTEGRQRIRQAAQDNRYRPSVHVDLMDVVTFAGAASRWPLAAYALGYGFASPKQDMDGAQVGPAVAAGRLLDVVRYCAGDVLATAHMLRCLHDELPAPAPRG